MVDFNIVVWVFVLIFGVTGYLWILDVQKQRKEKIIKALEEKYPGAGKYYAEIDKYGK